jgi:hypothetical protein
MVSRQTETAEFPYHTAASRENRRPPATQVGFLRQRTATPEATNIFLGGVVTRNTAKLFIFRQQLGARCRDVGSFRKKSLACACIEKFLETTPNLDT